MRLPSTVKLVEVGPRDGLQNEAATVPTEVKVDFIRRLGEAGFNVIEVGSFVSEKRVPQMADTAEVLAQIPWRDGIAYPVLVPNMVGLDAALTAGAREIAVFTAASETFCQRNLNCSVAESLDGYARVCAAAKERGIWIRGYVSCTLGCPFEGDIPREKVAKVAASFLRLGCDEISLGDTIGIGTPGKAQAMVQAVAEKVPRERLAVHFHDTYGQALANLLAVFERGIAIVDGSVAGLGGCPFAEGATGNVATEDVLYMLDGLGVRTGVSLEKVLAVCRFVTSHLGRAPASRVGVAFLGRQTNTIGPAQTPV